MLSLGSLGYYCYFNQSYDVSLETQRESSCAAVKTFLQFPSTQISSYMNAKEMCAKSQTTKNCTQRACSEFSLLRNYPSQITGLISGLFSVLFLNVRGQDSKLQDLEDVIIINQPLKGKSQGWAQEHAFTFLSCDPQAPAIHH